MASAALQHGQEAGLHVLLACSSPAWLYETSLRAYLYGKTVCHESAMLEGRMLDSIHVSFSYLEAGFAMAIKSVCLLYASVVGVVLAAKQLSEQYGVTWRRLAYTYVLHQVLLGVLAH